ncbi:hypothetical protein ACFY3E_39365 [Streptomyces griseorubiginosus]|uniref:hypothetical protein n=1 Tax=Streptomyces griseorubiginosus TaxID=67304 RepID=UPI00367C3C0C
MSKAVQGIMLDCMTMMCGPLDGVPMEVLFLGLDAPGRQRMLRAAAAVDAARPTGQVPQWQWFPDHIQRPDVHIDGAAPEILLSEISLYDEGGDWLEAAIDVEWTPAGRLNVCATMGMACWCPEDHGTHYAPSLNVSADDTTSLDEAFEVVTHHLVDWLGGSRDPAHWRAQANLPQRASLAPPAAQERSG